MKYLDDVKLIAEKEKYARFGVHKGDVGNIIEAWIVNNSFNVEIHYPISENNEFSEVISIDIGDLELIRDAGATDDAILSDLGAHANAWCKVEEGWIKNLRGEIKNKVQYDYNS